MLATTLSRRKITNFFLIHQINLIWDKNEIFFMNHMQHLVELSGKKKCARGNRCRDLKSQDAGGRCYERS